MTHNGLPFLLLRATFSKEKAVKASKEKTKKASTFYEGSEKLDSSCIFEDGASRCHSSLLFRSYS